MTQIGGYADTAGHPADTWDDTITSRYFWFFTSGDFTPAKNIHIYFRDRCLKDVRAFVFATNTDIGPFFTQKFSSYHMRCRWDRDSGVRFFTIPLINNNDVLLTENSMKLRDELDKEFLLCLRSRVPSLQKTLQKRLENRKYLFFSVASYFSTYPTTLPHFIFTLSRGKN